ncbi:MAG TPA: double-strand break repair helicase AddA [Verrucomicrobiae bacterium]|nr:double-strand break repair helicase AddA [Verrucomicrobiae bacterium]
MSKTVSAATTRATTAQRSATNPASSAWVAASAGSGKTKVLTDRVLRLLLDGTAPQHILCLTFTKAAAAEMSVRIAEQLERWTSQSDKELNKSLLELIGRGASDEMRRRARQLFARVLDAPGGMKIQTIHAFCQSVLKRFPLEAGIAPHFQVLDERSAAELFVDAREEVLGRARSDGAALLGRALLQVTRHVNETDFVALMQDLARKRNRLLELTGSPEALADTVRRLNRRLGVGDTESVESLITAACRDNSFNAVSLRRAVDALSNGGKSDIEKSDRMAGWLAGNELLRAQSLDEYAKAFLTGAKGLFATAATKAVVAAWPEIVAVLQDEGRRLQALFARCNAITLARATAGLLQMAGAMIAAYEQRKIVRAMLDYEDLIMGMVKLLSREGVAPWVLYKLDGGLDHILIDEAQDTSPEQWQVVAAIAAEFFAGEGASQQRRTIFAVGDEKQSIFSFQGADPLEFAKMRLHFDQRIRAAKQNLQTVPLNISFRSAQPVLDAVNGVFGAEIAHAGVITGGDWPEHETSRDGQAGLVELWPPVAPAEGEEPAPWELPLEPRPGDSPRQRLALYIAAFIADMIGRGEKLDSQNRAVMAGDFLVLVRRRNAFVDELIRALKSRSVAVAGIDRLVLTEHIAVMDLMALGQFLLLPGDDLTLATVLKSPLLNFTEEALFDLAYERGKQSLWSVLSARAGERADFAAAHRYLGDLLARVDFARPFDLYADLLSRGGGRKALQARLGFEALDPIDEFLALALAYEREHVPSLQGFLHWLANGAVEVKRELDEGARDKVRIMTVHGAKGLQAPIVILPDTTQLPQARPNLLWLPDGDGGEPDELLLWSPRTSLDEAVAAAARSEHRARQMAEYRRLLYVALTRAEDRLYVGGWQTGQMKQGVPEESWYSLIAAGLSERATAVAFDASALIGDEGWQGEALRLESAQVAAPDKAMEQGTAERAPPPAPPAWFTEAPAVEQPGARPLTPSRPEGEEPPVRTPLGGDDGRRFKRGRIIHRLLELLPAAPPARREAAARQFLKRAVHDLTAEAQDEIAREVFRVLEHPEFATLFGPGSQAEVPLVGELAGRDGPFILSGQIDRLIVSPEKILVLDYKTNRPPPTREEDVPEIYLKQMAAYRAALNQTYPGLPVECALLWTDGPLLMRISPDRLDRHAP